MEMLLAERALNSDVHHQRIASVPTAVSLHTLGHAIQPVPRNLRAFFKTPAANWSFPSSQKISLALCPFRCSPCPQIFSEQTNTLSSFGIKQT